MNTIILPRKLYLFLILFNLASKVSLNLLSINDPLSEYLVNLGYPANEYEHSYNRDLLIQKESDLEGRKAILDEKENLANQYLAYLKWREFKRSFSSGFPPSRPIEEKLDEIRTTEIYKELKSLPKGGNMHSHEDHLVSKRTLLEIVWASVDFPNLYMNSPYASMDPWKLDFFINPPDSSWIRIQDSNYTIDSILPYNTLIGLLTPDVSRYPTDSSQRWVLINKLWGRCASSLISNINIKPLYLEAMLQHGYDEGVTYFETRRNLASDACIYKLNPDPIFNKTNGKECLDTTGTLEITLAQETAANFLKTHPSFIGLKRISYSSRKSSHKKFLADMDKTYELHQIYPDHVLGFDAVGEEDAGYSSLYYISEYLSLSNGNVSRMPIFLHTAETNWPIDLMASMSEGDLLSSLENVFESILLHSKRIGHGNGFDKYPFLLALLKERNVAIEVCLISNQVLGFNADLRNHQGHGFYRLGVPIVFGPDDPGTIGYDDFNVDWYAAYMSWGLDISDLKRIAINSLNYSGMNPIEKNVAINQKWLPTWLKYIDQLSVKACSRDYAAEAKREGRDVIITRVFPKEGALTTSTRVHIFGKNLEVAICKNVTCKFDEETVPAIYISNQQLVCYSPECPNCDAKTVPVFISFDDETYINTNYTFGYKYDTLVSPTKNSKINKRS